MWTTEHTVSSAVPVDLLWPRLADPSRWATWDDAIERAELGEPMAVGAQGSLKPRGGPSSRFTVTAYEPERRLTDVTRLPLARMTFDHVWVPTPEGGTSLTHRISISGPLAPVFALLLGKRLARGLPEAMARLAATDRPG